MCIRDSYEAERHGVPYDPNTEIMATVGASEGIDLALRAIVAVSYTPLWGWARRCTCPSG